MLVSVGYFKFCQKYLIVNVKKPVSKISKMNEVSPRKLLYWEIYGEEIRKQIPLNHITVNLKKQTQYLSWSC